MFRQQILSCCSTQRFSRRWQGGRPGWLAEPALRGPAGKPAAEDGEDDDDVEDAAAAGGLTVLADALAGLVARLGAKAHVFALGTASEAVGMPHLRDDLRSVWHDIWIAGSGICASPAVPSQDPSCGMSPAWMLMHLAI